MKNTEEEMSVEYIIYKWNAQYAVVIQTIFELFIRKSRREKYNRKYIFWIKLQRLNCQ